MGRLQACHISNPLPIFQKRDQMDKFPSKGPHMIVFKDTYGIYKTRELGFKIKKNKKQNDK
jgi:hypothetical protein